MKIELVGKPVRCEHCKSPRISVVLGKGIEEHFCQSCGKHMAPEVRIPLTLNMEPLRYTLKRGF